MSHYQNRIHSLRNANIHKRNTARLPHWELDNAFYTITFRLHDSLPSAVVRRLIVKKEEARGQILRREGRAPTREEKTALQAAFAIEFDELLDRGYGACWLKNPDISQIVADALRFLDHKRYQLEAWTIMPNHLHVVMFLDRGSDLSRVLHSWKSYTASKANRILGRSGPFWQKGYFDRIVRDEDDLLRCINYVVENPARAGLENWPWVWRRK